MASDGTIPGGRVGARITQLVADGMVHTRARSAGLSHDLALRVQRSFFDLVGGEIHRTLGPLFEQLADGQDAPDWARLTFGFLARETGQWQAFLATSAGGAAVSSGLIPLLNNELAPVTQNLIAQNPNFLIDVGTAAAISARGIAPHGQMDAEARRQGISSGRFGRMVRAAQHGMSPGDVVAGVNRRTLSQDQALDQLQDAGFTSEAARETLALRAMLLTPQELAVLVNFGVLSEDAARPDATRSGMSADDFHQLVLGNGQPPAIQELLFAYRRGIIDQDRLRRGITQSPVRREWFDVIEALRFMPPPTETALSAATQNLLSEAKARRIWTENGFDPSGFDWALESNGRPLGIEQAAELYNRGIITKAEARQMFLESAIKNKYVDLVFPLFERIPTLETVGRMVREGVKSKAEGIAALRDLGFTSDAAQDLIQLYSAERTAGTRELTVGTIQELYEDSALDAAAATEALTGLGYDPDEAGFILAIRELRRQRALQAQAISRVRARFTSYKLTEAEAYAALDQLQVPVAQRDQLVDTWNVEREVNAPQLTGAQISAAYKRGLIDQGSAASRFSELGYDQDSVGILLQLAVPASSAGG